MNAKRWMSLGCAFAASLLIAQEGNLIPNPGFEEELDKKMWKMPAWVRKVEQGKKYFDPEVDTTVSQGTVGGKSLKLATLPGKPSTYAPMYDGKNITLPAGMKEGTIAMWVKNEAPLRKKENLGRLEFFVYLSGKDKKAIQIGLITPWERTLPEWTYISQDFVVPEGYTNASLTLKFSGNSLPMTTWVDNLYFGPKIEKGENEKAVKPSEKGTYLVRAVHHAAHGGIYYPGEPVVYELHFRNIREPGKKLNLSWSIRDFDEKELNKGTSEIALERRVDFTLPVPKDYMGFYTVKMEIFDDGKYLDGGLYSGMVIEKQEKRDSFFSTRGCNTFEKHVRMGFGPRILTPGSAICWAVEVAPEKYNFDSIDQCLATAQAAGYTEFYCHTHFGCAMLPRHKQADYTARINKGEDPYTEEDFEAYRKCCRAIMERYGKIVTDWRVPDEIMLTRHTPVGRLQLSYYYKFCKIFFEEMKKVNPDAKLYAGGAMFGESKYTGLKAQVWDKMKNDVDGLAVDAYTQGASIGVGQNFLGPEQLKLRETYLRTFNATGCKGFVNEETGSAIQRDLPLNHDLLKYYAVVNARIITVCKSLDQVKAWTHFLIEDVESAWNGNFDYAAWKNNNPRPHAYTLALVQRELAFTTNGVEVKPHADIYAYVFKRQGKVLLAIWAMSKDGIEAKIDMPSDWHGRTVTGQPVSGKSGVSSLKLTDRPYYLELDASQDDVIEAVKDGKYAVPAAKLTLNRKSGDEVTAFVENKTNEPLNAEVTLNGSKAKLVHVDPMATKAVDFAQKPCKKFVAELTTGGVKTTITKDDELFLVQRLSAAPALDGTLKGFENVTPIIFDKSDVLLPIDAAAWGYWTGPKDLSAKLYLAYDNDYFYVAADVLDDVHIARGSEFMIWNQDCLQYAFDTENDTFDPLKSRGGFNPDDREFCMALTPKGPQNFCYTAPTGLSSKVIPDKVSVTHKDGRTVYEGRIPWRYFGKLGPKSGSVFGFNVVFFDIDIPTGAIPYRMELSPGIADGKGPAFYKRFMLK